MTPETPVFTNYRTEFAGVPLHQLAEQFGTPVYLYDAAVIRKRVQELQQFDVVRFAQKACPNLAILKLVRETGAFVDSVSANEIRRAIKAGYSPDIASNATATFDAKSDVATPIVYTADIFDRDALQVVLENNVHVNCGSLDMISQYGASIQNLKYAKNRREITLRINPGFGHGHSQKTNTGGPQSKHGIWHEQLSDCIQLAAKFGLTISGLHMHIGSGTDLEHLSQCCDVMVQLARSVGKSVSNISTGGGLPVPYSAQGSYVDINTYFSLWDTVRKQLETEFGHKITLETEPGRYLVAESCLLLCEIRAVKQQGENTFYLLDAGFNNLARPIMYGAYHPMSVVFAKPKTDVNVAADGTHNLPERDVVIGGPLCESGDIFTQEEGGFVIKRKLPQAQVGDYLAIEVAGAYGAAMGSNYNSKSLAAEVLIEQGKAQWIRRRQTFEHLIENEIIS